MMLNTLHFLQKEIETKTAAVTNMIESMYVENPPKKTQSMMAIKLWQKKTSIINYY